MLENDANTSRDGGNGPSVSLSATLLDPDSDPDPEKRKDRSPAPYREILLSHLMNFSVNNRPMSHGLIRVGRCIGLQRLSGGRRRDAREDENVRP